MGRSLLAVALVAVLGAGSVPAFAEPDAEAVSESTEVGADSQTVPEVTTPAPQLVPVETPPVPQPETVPAEGESAELQPEPDASIPAVLPVEGVVVAFPDERGAHAGLGFEHADAGSEQGSEHLSGGLWLVTPADQFLPVGEELAATGVARGDQVAATVVVSAEARSEIAVAVAAGEPLAADEMVDIVSETARAAQETVELAEVTVTAEATAPMAALPGHQVDVVYLGERSQWPSAQQLSGTVQQVLNFWGEQTSGVVTSAIVSQVFVETRNGLCDPYEAWGIGATQSGRSTYQYMSGGYPGRHLLVLSQGCGGGLASLGGLHQGGAAWGGISGGLDRHLQLIAHEFGHNLGLQHGDVRDCIAPHSDAAWSAVGRNTWLPGAVCRDIEYGDAFNVMGGSNTPGLNSLPIAQRHMLLGSTAESYIAGLAWEPGASRTFTLHALGSNSGVRGLRVSGPTSGEAVYLEYREPVGSDSSIRDWPVTLGAGTLSPGVRILKARQMSDQPIYYNAFVSTVIGQAKGGTRTFSFAAGDQISLFDGAAQIQVLSAGGGVAQVRVDLSARFTHTPTPVFSAKPAVGAEVSVTTGGWDPVPDFEYVWAADGVTIPAATGSRYTPSAGDSGKHLTVQVTAKLPGYRSVTVTSEPVGVSPTRVASTRLAGGDRFQTAVEISRAEFTDPAAVDTVVLATAYNFADALSAAPLAAKLGAPLLLTQQNVLTEATRLEIDRLNPRHVIIIGGPPAISSAVESALAGRYTVERLAGEDRYETSLKVVERGWGPNSSAEVFVATGRDFPDALAAGAAAAVRGTPVLLVHGTDGQPSAAALGRIAQLGAGTAYIAGSSSAVSTGIEQGLRAAGLNIQRFNGTDRFDTAARIANHFGVLGGTVFLASGTNYPDALAGAAVAGRQTATLVLSRQECLVSVSAPAITRIAPSKVTLLGGTPALSGAVGGYTICR